MRTVRLPVDRRDRVVRPLSPATIERLRGQLEAQKRFGDAVLVSVLAYVGPRPAEALALRWADVGERTVRFYAPKTNRDRSARLLAPVRADLLAWRLRCGSPDDRALVFPRAHGGHWTDDDWRNWRRRTFASALKAVGVPDAVRPYDLRHSAASLWLHEGRSVLEVARWLGHKPSMTLDTYGHVIEELADADERPSAEAAIRAARDEMCPNSVRQAREARSSPGPRGGKGPPERTFREEPSVGLEPTTPSLPWKCSTN